MSAFLQSLRGTLLSSVGTERTDGQLLEGFVHRRDEAALAALVRRHGPMVWGTCRRVLGNYHDAEDAFQAAFLVLVRKAASIVPREMVANWLYGVAHQTALKARAMATRRKGRERQVAEMPEPATAEQDFWRDLQPLLDQELSRLSDKYRVVLVLCDLEGKTRKETACQLGVPEGTVAGRLARARTMLAKRLAQRGVVLSGGALATILSRNVASACVPISVTSSTIKAASLIAAGQAAAGVITANVAALMGGVLKTMLLNNLKVATAVLLAVTVVGGGAGGLFYPTRAAEPAIAQTAPKLALRKEETPAKKRAKLEDEREFLKKLLQVEREVVPFPDDKEKPIEPNLGFYPPAKALLEKAKEAEALREARKKAYVKLLAIAEIEAALKKLAENTNDKADRAELDKIEQAVRALREKELGKVYPLEDLRIKEKQEKK
jgi:RNA polymerase sigma factor (sigma-70 family)